MTFLSHAAFLYLANDFVIVLRGSKAYHVIGLKLLSEERIAGAPLTIKAKPNHHRVGTREHNLPPRGLGFPIRSSAARTILPELSPKRCPSRST
jgi:hypothetical protein